MGRRHRLSERDEGRLMSIARCNHRPQKTYYSYCYDNDIDSIDARVVVALIRLLLLLLLLLLLCGRLRTVRQNVHTDKYTQIGKAEYYELVKLFVISVT